MTSPYSATPELNTRPSTPDAARAYIRRGYAVVPIPAGAKGPITPGWQQLSLSERDVARYFPEASNIGVLLGEPSGGLIDIDLDADHARRLAPLFLPATAMKSGRAGSPSSHWYYRVRDPLKPAKLIDPMKADSHVTVVEIRSTRQQTIIPPSVHPSGEPVEWYADGEPAEIDGDTLVIAVKQLAAAALLARWWPEKGRHQAALALAGGLYRGGWRLPEIEKFVLAVTEAAMGDAGRQRADEWTRAIEDTTARLDAGDTMVTGWPSLAREMGGELEYGRVVSRAREWLGMENDEIRLPPGVYSLDDTGNAQRFIARHGSEVRYLTDTREWLVWSGSRWERDETGILARAIETAQAIDSEASHASDRATQAAIRRHGSSSRARPRIEAIPALAKSNPAVSARSDRFDAEPWLLNLQNGVLDLRTGSLLPHDPTRWITKLAPIAFDPDAHAPRWERFIDEVTDGDTELAGFLQRAAGYSLTGSTRAQVFFGLYGPTGQNGKGTFINTLGALFGEGEYACAVPFSAFTIQKYDTSSPYLARLPGARFAYANETEHGTRFAASRLKELTGEDTVTARALYANPLTFRPAAKLWLSFNDLPEVDGADTAMWRRVLLVPFNVRIPDNQRDDTLRGKLAAELPGILNWALAGCIDWQRDGLRPPSAVIAATENYRVEMDPVRRFAEERLLRAPGEGETVAAMRGAYSRWCLANGEDPVSDKAFSSRLKALGFQQRRTDRERYWANVRLAEDLDRYPLAA